MKMQNPNITKSDTNGSALMTVLLIVIISSILIAAFLSSNISRSFMAKKLSNRVRATAIAEAGINDAYSILATNFNARENDNAFPATAYGDGIYDVTVTAISNNIAIIKSTGTYGKITETVILDVKNITDSASSAPLNDIWQYAIVSGGDMTWTGSGTMNIGGGKIHTNGKYKHTGSSVLNGNLSSCIRIWCTGSTQINGNTATPIYKGSAPANITGTITIGAVPIINIQNIDLTPYYNYALAHGEVYDGNKRISTGEVKPNGGIMWINGNLRMSTSDNMIGCFIATGDVDITGSGDQIKVGDFPAIISRDGDIDISGSGKFHGLIYAKNGDFDKSGSGDVTGSIICAGEFDKSGSWSAMTYENSKPLPPGETATPSDTKISPTAWQK
jgi:hypothetical protein